MSGLFTETEPAAMAAEASRILTEVRWPESDEAQKFIGRALAVAAETLQIYYAVLNDDMDPYKLHAPDMGWWDDPERQALEYVDDEALQCAEGLRRLLDEKLRDAARQMAGDVL